MIAPTSGGRSAVVTWPVASTKRWNSASVRATGTLHVWAEPFTVLRLPKLFDRRADPYERADVTSDTSYDRHLSSAGVIDGALAGTEQFLNAFRDYPPRQPVSSISIDQAVEELKQSLSEKRPG